ncbi:uncharacterized protein V1518DRAFT_417413 [Limtongia smithiae]|uniref:uncharacterized protein n=1 Tax=Limtongia smithiae TaxID=1125753 RepID=UPI0034CE2FAF
MLRLRRPSPSSRRAGIGIALFVSTPFTLLVQMPSFLSFPAQKTRADKIAGRALTQRYAASVLVLSAVALVVVVVARAVLLPRLPRALRRPRAPVAVIMCLVAGVLCACSLSQVTDVVFLAKRLGRVSAAVLPAVLFLVLKPSPLPAMPYMSLLSLHVWVGRLFVLWSTVHGTVYAVVFVHNRNFLEKISKPDNFAGVLLTLGFVITTIVSISRIRSRNHELFYRTHLVFAWIAVPLLLYHARPRVWLIAAISAALLTAQLAQHILMGRRMSVKVAHISPYIQVVSLPRDRFPRILPAVAHVRIGPAPSAASPFWFLSASHPYTIAATEDRVVLIVKPSRRFHFFENIDYMVYGPYSSLAPEFYTDLDPRHQPARRIVLIAGGVGISFAAPLATALRSLGERVDLVWAVRSSSDIICARSMALTDADVYVSPDITEFGERAWREPKLGKDGEYIAIPPNDENEFGYELESLSPKLVADGSPVAGSDAEYALRNNIRVHEERLPIGRVLRRAKDTVNDANGELCVVSSGGQRLVEQCSAWGRKLGATVHEELYEI